MTTLWQKRKGGSPPLSLNLTLTATVVNQEDTTEECRSALALNQLFEQATPQALVNGSFAKAQLQGPNCKGPIARAQ